MGSKNIRESQQQEQGITIGTQGNDNQPTPLGEDLDYNQKGGQSDKSIPNQENSSATNKQQAEENRGE